MKIRRERETDRYLMGQASANSDIAQFGVEFAETFMLSGVEVLSDGFLDGYSQSIQKHYHRSSP